MIPHPEPVPTPTYHEQAVEITADITVDICMRYVDDIQLVFDNRYNEFNLLSSDDIPLILSVMANESSCNPTVVSHAGAIGIMQIIPKIYYDNCLHQTPCNIYWGIWILDNAIRIHGLEMGLAAYNCSLEGIANDMCGPTGGLHYADRVLNFWLPRFQDLTDG